MLTAGYHIAVRHEDAHVLKVHFTDVLVLHLSCASRQQYVNQQYVRLNCAAASR